MKKLLRLQITALFLLLVLSIAFCIILNDADRAMSVTAESRPASPADTVQTESVPETTESMPVQTEPLPEPTTLPTPTWMTFPKDRALKAQQYFVYDCDADQFLEKSGSGKIYPASVTKLFTAYIATQYLDLQKNLTAGDVLDLVAWDSSVANLQKGDVLTTERAVEAMLLPSGNDAAYVLAVETGKVILDNPDASIDAALDAFMKEMNSKAKKMGMTSTHFMNPDGIHDDNHYTSIEDLVILGKMALHNPVILKNTKISLDTVTLNSGEKTWHNTNALIDPQSPYYCPYAVGLKTGQTASAGSCLLSAFQLNGRTLLIGVFGCPEEKDRFEDSLQLFNRAIGI